MVFRTVLRFGLLASALVSLASSEALASGTYMGRPSRPNASVDRSSYELGKKVFAGEFVAADRAGNRADQAEVLGDLQSRLPHRVRSRVDLTEYAGRLDGEQLDALRYYLARRYKVQIDG